MGEIVGNVDEGLIGLKFEVAGLNFVGEALLPNDSFEKKNVFD